MPGPSLIDHFAALEDPRQSWKVLHPLPEVLLLVLCYRLPRSLAPAISVIASQAIALGGRPAVNAANRRRGRPKASVYDRLAV